MIGLERLMISTHCVRKSFVRATDTPQKGSEGSARNEEVGPKRQ